jgi:hypothetical protein
LYPPKTSTYHDARYQLHLFIEHLQDIYKTEALSIDEHASFALALNNGDHFYLRLHPSGHKALAYFSTHLDAARPIESHSLDTMGGANHEIQARIDVFDERNIVVSSFVEGEPIEVVLLKAEIEKLHTTYLTVKAKLR